MMDYGESMFLLLFLAVVLGCIAGNLPDGYEDEEAELDRLLEEGRKRHD